MKNNNNFSDFFKRLRTDQNFIKISDKRSSIIEDFLDDQLKEQGRIKSLGLTLLPNNALHLGRDQQTIYHTVADFPQHDQRAFEPSTIHHDSVKVIAASKKGLLYQDAKGRLNHVRHHASDPTSLLGKTVSIDKEPTKMASIILSQQQQKTTGIKR